MISEVSCDNNEKQQNPELSPLSANKHTGRCTQTSLQIVNNLQDERIINTINSGIWRNDLTKCIILIENAISGQGN